MIRWRNRWLDLEFGGRPAREWCSKTGIGTGLLYCKVCDVEFSFAVKGKEAIRIHAMSRQHNENLKAVRTPFKASVKTKKVPSAVMKKRHQKSKPNTTSSKAMTQQRPALPPSQVKNDKQRNSLALSKSLIKPRTLPHTSGSGRLKSSSKQKHRTMVLSSASKKAKSGSNQAKKRSAIAAIALARTNKWQDHWLDVVYDGFSFREWCSQVDKMAFHCKACKSEIRYLHRGIGALKDHAMTKRHRENLRDMTAQFGKKFPVPSSASAVSQKQSVTSIKSPTQKCDIDPAARRLAAFTTCDDNSQLSRNLTSSPESRRCKLELHRVYDSSLGPIPYYQLSSDSVRDTFLIPVYPCCYCPDEFASKQLLHEHLTSCIMKPPVLQAVIPSDADIMRSICEEEDPPPPSICRLTLVGRTPTQASSPTNSRFAQDYSKSDFISGLGLLPKRKARQVSQRRRNTECESIDLEEEIPMTPTTPGLSRTPKLLISHLSREGNNEHFRRQLSFNVDGGGKTEKYKDSVGNVAESGAGEGEDGGEESGEEEKDERKVTVSKSLYNLDVTSPLGQFAIKHFRGDPSLHILSDIESHCLTSTAQPKHSSVSRLRVRQISYPVTFRYRHWKHFGDDFVHQYKFKKAEVREFMRTANTGLNKSSRRLRRQMKPCKVVLKPVTKADLRRWIPSQNHLTIDLKPLSAAEIAFWTMPKPPPSMDSQAVFPNGLKFTSPNVNSILGLKMRQRDNNVSAEEGLRTSSLTLCNFVSEEICAEVLQNRKVLYRSLLSDCSNLNKEDGAVGCEISSAISQVPSSHHSILRQMLNLPPTNCFVTESHSVPESADDSTNISSKISALGRKYSPSTSPSIRLIPIDSPKALRNTSELVQCSSSTKRKISFSCSPQRDRRLAVGRKKEKGLGQFSVAVKSTSEGKTISSFLGCPENTHSSARQDTNKDSCNKRFPHNRSSLRPGSTNGVAAQTRTLRSSQGLRPFRLDRRDLRGGNIIASVRQRNHRSHRRSNSSHSKSNRRPVSFSKESSGTSHPTKEVISGLRRPSLENSKSSQLHAPNNRAVGSHSKSAFNSKSQEISSLPQESRAFRQKLTAAGLLRRESVSSSSVPASPVPHTPERQTSKPIVPILTKLAQNLSSVTTSSFNAVFGKRPSPGKPDPVPNKVQKRSKSLCGNGLLSETSRYEEQRRQRDKDRKRKNFMLWLQNLRKGNIT